MWLGTGRWLRAGVLGLGVLAAGAAETRADTISTFSLNTTTQNGSISGTLRIDVTTGQAVDGSFTLNLNGSGGVAASYALAGNFGPTHCNDCFDYPHDSIFTLVQGTTFLTLEDDRSLIGFTGGALCGTPENLCDGSGDGSLFRVASNPAWGNVLQNLGPAQLVLVSTTSTVPEPGSVALLGTGVLGLAGVVRRRRR